MAIETTKLTYETFLKLPETKQRYEVIDGELFFMAPAPTPEHQIIVRNLFRRLDQFVREHDLGEVLFAPLDVLIRRDPLRTRQPDVLFVRKHRTEIIGRQLIETGPDLVVEILSPANTRTDLDEKLRDYWAINVQERWLVSPEASTVEVLHYTASGFERGGLFGVGDLLNSAILPEFHFHVEDIR